MTTRGGHITPNTDRKITCMDCGKQKHQRDGFPDQLSATCWSCAWDRHVRVSHKKIGRRIRREAKKRARRITTREVEAAMFAHERRQVLGLVNDPASEEPTR